MALSEMEDSLVIKFRVFFGPKLQSDANWCATEIKLTVQDKFPGRKSSQSTDFGRRLSQATDSGSQQELELPTRERSSVSTLSVASTRVSRLSDANSRSVSFVSSGLESLPSSILGDGSEIINLCSALEQRSKVQQSLGFLRDGLGRCYAIDFMSSPLLSPSDTSKVLSLESLLTGDAIAGDRGIRATNIFPRRTRLAIAVVLANSLLQLHTGPWLPETWGKRDIHFFQGSDGTIHLKHPFLLRHFRSTSGATRSEPDLSKLHFGLPPSRAGNPSLFSLGVIVLELWFNQTLESQPFRNDFLGPEGRENEFTDFNTAQKWQEMTMEEAGPDLYNPTRRCIYCAFGAASQNLEDDELKKAVYAEVVEPLERLLGRFEEVLTNEASIWVE
jgi:hypothetical protein